MIHCEEDIKLILIMSGAMPFSITDVVTLSSYLKILCVCILETPPHIHRKDILYWLRNSDRLRSDCTCSSAGEKPVRVSFGKG